MAETSAKQQQPRNTENPVFLPIFVFRLKQWLYATQTRARRFITFGVITEKGKTIVWNVTHAIRHRAANNVPPSSWASPFQPFPPESLPPPLDGTYNAGGAALEDLPMPAAFGNQYTVSSDSRVDFDEKLFVEIVSCWDSESVQDNLRESCGSSALRLIAKLHDDVTKLGPEANAKLADVFEQHRKTVLPSPTINAFQDAVSLGDAYNAVVVTVLMLSRDRVWGETSPQGQINLILGYPTYPRGARARARCERSEHPGVARGRSPPFTKILTFLVAADQRFPMKITAQRTRHDALPAGNPYPTCISHSHIPLEINLQSGISHAYPGIT